MVRRQEITRGLLYVTYAQSSAFFPPRSFLLPPELKATLFSYENQSVTSTRGKHRISTYPQKPLRKKKKKKKTSALTGDLPCPCFGVGEGCIYLSQSTATFNSSYGRTSVFRLSACMTPLSTIRPCIIEALAITTLHYRCFRRVGLVRKCY